MKLSCEQDMSKSSNDFKTDCILMRCGALVVI